MLQNKSNRIISEIQSFFSTSEKAAYSLLNVLSSLTISRNLFSDKINTVYSGKNLLLLLLLFPFFEIKDIGHYSCSALYRFVKSGKDTFYRFLNDSNTNWRNIVYSITVKLLKNVESSSIEKDPKPIRCLIVDDTDFPKTGSKTELIGRVFSHVGYKSILGFKGLFLCYHDGKSLFSLDYSLHGEKGKNEKRPFGLTKKEAKSRYNKKREKSSEGLKRIDEYIQSKVMCTIMMIRRAIKKGIRFDYLLVDSWFTCTELISFIKTRHIGCHFLGMIKMGNTKYNFNGKQLTSKEIAHSLQRGKKVKRNKQLNCWYCQATVKLRDTEVKLFFCKNSRKGKWNGLLSTNTKLDFAEAYQIYSTRWTVEVYFKESKQYLGLGKCQSRDFDGQIAHTAICMLQYNLLSVVKRFEDYETIGELFRTAQADTLELTVKERIWQIIIEIMAELAELLEIDIEMLMEKLFAENEKFIKLLNYKSWSQTG